MIRTARSSDIEDVARMRLALWPDGTLEEHAQDFEALLAGEWSHAYPYVVFVAEEDERLVGFAEATLRSYADGCDPRQAVGYLEGWYVDETHRRRGVGAALLRAAEEWARAQGCIEMASDTWIDNELSQRAHRALGFEEVDRVVTYRKEL